jgi:polyhydroxyalkanoate synthesis regulator phasin
LLFAFFISCSVFSLKVNGHSASFLRMLETWIAGIGAVTMGLGDLVQKAVYLGVGLASLAGEKAGETLGELRVQVQKMADEMVERGEMNADEARKFVDDMLKKAQQPQPNENSSSQPSEPRRIEILDDGEPESTAQPQQAGSDVDEMRRRVMELQEELKRLKKP